MTDVVFAHEGTVAKIIGDAIQIFFNAPGDQPDYATRAIGCAHALDDWAEAFRERWKSKGVNFGATRIGVHAGPALVGNFGGGRFFDYTAYGDTINTAARLEAADKFLGTRICVSAAVADSATAFRGRPVGAAMLRGRSEPLRAYEPQATAVFEGPATAQYCEAFAKLEAGDATAMPAFAALVGLHANDALAGLLYLRRPGSSTLAAEIRYHGRPRRIVGPAEDVCAAEECGECSSIAPADAALVHVYSVRQPHQDHSHCDRQRELE